MSEQQNEKYVRPTWDEYFMEIANTVSKRATCDRGRSGCVIARDRQLLVSGYVGSPIGLPHCDTFGHQMKKMIHEDNTVTMHCVRTVHAEQNAIIHASRLDMLGATLFLVGVDAKTGEIVSNAEPCKICKRMIINAGIKSVVVLKPEGETAVFSVQQWVDSNIDELEYAENEWKFKLKPGF